TSIILVRYTAGTCCSNACVSCSVNSTLTSAAAATSLLPCERSTGNSAPGTLLLCSIQYGTCSHTTRCLPASANTCPQRWYDVLLASIHGSCPLSTCCHTCCRSSSSTRQETPSMAR